MEKSKDELNEIKAERTLSDAALLKGGARYVADRADFEPRLEITDQQYEKLFQEMEEILSKDFLTREKIEDGTVEIKIEKAGSGETARMIEYEFEVENESRYVIEPGVIENYDWKNHVVDTYDQSGRARIRIKNNKPRLSLKVPLFTRDTATSKTCLRLEFKPINEQQEHDLNRVRELILKEAGVQVSEKWGAQIVMQNGKKVWINRDNHNNWWIEVDEGVEFEPPKDVKVLRIEKSVIKTE